MQTATDASPILSPEVSEPQVVQAPHGRTWALLALGMGGVGIGTGEFAPMGLLPQIADGVDVSITTGGHAISAYALGVVVGAPLIAVLAAGVRRRLLLTILMVTFALGNVMSALAPEYGSLLLARFVAGLPHGAYFGIASLVAASLVPAERRTWAVGQVLLGLSIANLVLVPAITLLGQQLSWRYAFGIVAGIGVVASLLVLRFVPDVPVQRGASMLRELGALKRPQVLLTLAMGAIGFGGMFGVYSYVAPTFTERGGMREGLVPLILVIWGLGMVIGNIYVTRLVDRWPTASLFGLLASFAVFLSLFALVSRSPVLAAIVVFFIGLGVAFAPALQTRLMDVAGDAQALAATLNHSAFNIANALGAWIGGVAYDSTGSWAAPAIAGVGLSLGGLVLAAITVGLARRQELAPAT
ncbi:MAG: transporter [Thermoleophilia bacterium]|nr:transporter [Thermoleophilia bacterium]